MLLLSTNTNQIKNKLIFKKKFTLYDIFMKLNSWHWTDISSKNAQKNLNYFKFSKFTCVNGLLLNMAALNGSIILQQYTLKIWTISLTVYCIFVLPARCLTSALLYLAACCTRDITSMTLDGTTLQYCLMYTHSLSPHATLLKT